METAVAALVALATRECRIDGHAVARFQSLHGRTGLQHGARTLVPDGRRVLQNLIADASVEVVDGQELLILREDEILAIVK
jgi:co-chaperonin GroES (HSP10)